jgi:hypothetical protein
MLSVIAPVNVCFAGAALSTAVARRITAGRILKTVPFHPISMT